MKKILFSLVISVACLGLIGGALAYFTDTETSEGNTFTAGTLTLLLDDNPFNVTNMAPGDTNTAYLEIKNDGSLDMLFRAYLIDVVQDPEGFIDQFILTVTLNPSDYTPELEGDGIYGPADTVIFWGPLSDFWGAEKALDNVFSAFYGEDGPFPPGEVITYRIDVELDPETGNEFQDASLTADLRVDATQFDNQDPDNILW